MPLSYSCVDVIDKVETCRVSFNSCLYHIVVLTQLIIFKFSLRRGWGILLPRIRSWVSEFWVSDISKQHSSLILKYPNVHQVSRLSDWSATLVCACTIIPTFGSHTHCHQNMQHGQDDVCSTKLPYTAAPTHPSRPTLRAKGVLLTDTCKTASGKKRMWLQVR